MKLYKLFYPHSTEGYYDKSSVQEKHIKLILPAIISAAIEIDKQEKGLDFVTGNNL